MILTKYLEGQLHQVALRFLTQFVSLFTIVTDILKMYVKYLRL